MNHSFDVSTIIFAALAVFVVWKLRSVLGTRTGQERPPSNPFARRDQAGGPSQSNDNVVTLPGQARPAQPPELDPNRWNGMTESGSNAATGLDAIKAADPNFQGRSFMEGARAAYEMILAAFAKGDRDTLRPLLASDVFEGFSGAIADREQRGETAQHSFVSMDKAVVEEAAFRDRLATVTVRFESQQSNALRTKDGTPAPGSNESVSPVIDHWTFQRDVGSRDPNWKLIATNAD